METKNGSVDNQSPLDLDDFSLAKGGPFFRLLVRLGLMRPDFSVPWRRAIFLALFTWLPLLILSALQGVALGGSLKPPFLFDFVASVRFLIALPLLIVAEVVIDSRSKAAVKHLIGSGLVKEKDFPSFKSAVEELSKWRDSLWAEAVLAGIVILISSFVRLEISGTVSTWQVVMTSSAQTRTLAGWYFVIISIPIFQFLLLRWLWRFLIWSRFLWHISRLDLELIPTHPDMAGGLGFLASAQAKYGTIVLAGSSIISASIAGDIIFGRASFEQYKMMIIGYVVLIVIFFLCPLVFFTPKLTQAKRRGLLEYGALANEYTRSFDRKWIKREAPEGEVILGSSDIQSLADLGNSFAIVKKMRAFPFDRNSIIPLAASAIIPMLPLTLFVFPLEEIVMKILKLLF